MNLLCPNCQKPLTVPEQYAGQPIRCPLCSGTFYPLAANASRPSAHAPTASRALCRRRVLRCPSPDTYGLKDPIAPPPLRLRKFPIWRLSQRLPLERVRLPWRNDVYTPQTYTDTQPSYPSTPTPEGYQQEIHSLV